MAASKYLRKLIKQLIPDKPKKAPQVDEPKKAPQVDEPKKAPSVSPQAEKPKATVSSKPKKKGVGRPKRRRGIPPATPIQKAAAKKAGIGVKAFRALPDAEQKEWIKKAGTLDKPKVVAGPRRTRKEESELDRLTAEQKKEMEAALRPSKKTSGGVRRKRLTPEGQKLFNKGNFDEIIANPKKYITDPTDAPLRPKGTKLSSAERKELKGGSPDDKAEYIRNVLLEDPGHVVATPSQAGRLMRGQGEVPEGTEKEILKLTKGEGGPGFEILGEKGGGRLKYYKKGGRIKKSSKKPRGVGKALRGYGRAMSRG